MKTIKLFNHDTKLGHLISILVKLKDIPVTLMQDLPENVPNTNDPVIQDNNTLVRGVNPIIEYLEERYPEPKFYPFNTPEERAFMRMLTSSALSDNKDENTSFWNQVTTCLNEKPNSPYILNDKISILDAITAAVAPQTAALQKHKNRIMEYIHSL